MVGLVQPEDRGRAPGGREPGALEKEPARRVPRANRADDAARASVLRPLDRRLEEHRSDLLPAVARGDERPEEVGVVEPRRDLDAREADDLAVDLVHEERFLGRDLPVGELALELLRGRPEGIAHLLLRLLQRMP